jgi:hypothetical protein
MLTCQSPFEKLFLKYMSGQKHDIAFVATDECCAKNYIIKNMHALEVLEQIAFLKQCA